MVMRAAALDRGGLALQPSDVPLAVEVLSPSNAGYDVMTKRHQYGHAGIPQYWIVDPGKRVMTVLLHDGHEGYLESDVVSPGTTWRTDQPFAVALDPAEFL
jgi:Uma2 family endonuclease